MSEMEPENVFSYLSDDVVLNIFFKLVDDPRHWSRLACVCTKFSSLIRTICWKTKCRQAIPAVVSDLIPANSSVSSAVAIFSSLHKLAVCCPGLVHSGVLLENSDFGLERDLGPDENYHEPNLFQSSKSEAIPSCSRALDRKINGAKPNFFQSSTSEANSSKSEAIPCCSTALDDKINGPKPNCFQSSKSEAIPSCSTALGDKINGVKPNLFQSSKSEAIPSCSTDKIRFNSIKPNFFQSSKSEANPSSTALDHKINGVKPNLFQSESNPSCSTPLDEVRDKINGVKPNFNGSDCSWSLYDDLYLDTVYNNSSKSQDQSDSDPDPVPNPDPKLDSSSSPSNSTAIDVIKQASDFSICKKRKICRSLTSHLASEAWNFSREQGNKLLASRFRGDCLYICDWPGCVHTEEKRNYMLFRGVFKNFKRSRVWRTINDGNRSKIDLNCAFCPSDEVWELHSAFCLRPAYGFHDDGEPVVRAYVCENGHVSGAWTDWPLYT